MPEASLPQSLGPLIVDMQAFALGEEERAFLRHPAVGGVILFTRNFADVAQLRALVSEIRGLREPRLLVTVDHEGGRVQRFRQPLQVLPPAGDFGRIFDYEPDKATRLAEQAGWLMAAELLALRIDLSFAPVLDIDTGISEVIGNRAFHREPGVVAELAAAFARGMRRAGMHTVGKHFPGHGAVAADSHSDQVTDPRPLVEIAELDLLPYARLVEANLLSAVMPAHVVYSAVDAGCCAGFSRFWLEEALRGEFGFNGIIVSDDLSMAGAAGAGTAEERAARALDAGCDAMLVCNDPQAARQCADSLNGFNGNALCRLYGDGEMDWDSREDDVRWRAAVAALDGMRDAAKLEVE